MANGGHFAVVAAVFPDDIVGILYINDGLRGDAVGVLAVIGDVVVQNHIDAGVAFGQANIGELDGIYVHLSGNYAHRNRHGNKTLGASAATGVGLANQRGFLAVVVKQMEKAVVNVFAGRRQIGRSALFGAADDHGAGFTQRRVFDLSGFGDRDPGVFEDTA